MERHKKHIEGDSKSRLTCFCVNAPRYEYACWCQVACQGERTWKLTGNVMSMYINGQGYVDGVEFEKTLYVNPYLVITEEGYTKHFYIEGERVCSKIGGSGWIGPTGPNSPPLDFIVNDAPTTAAYLWKMVEKGVECSEFNPNHVVITPAFNTFHIRYTFPETDLYFYHSDHLGSSSFITDAIGYATQHLQYLPFGETFVDQQNGYKSRYTFSAKEKDDETQYSYFGARYYDSDLSVFLSIDKFAEKYPHLSSYNYCSLNPVNLIDINGDSMVLNGISSGFEGYTGDDRLQSFESYLKEGTGGKVDVSFHSKSPDGAEDVTFEMTLKDGETLTDEEQQFFDYITTINGMENDYQVGLGDLDFGEMPKGVFYANNYSGSHGMTYDVAFDYKLLNAMPSGKNEFGFGKIEMLMLGLSKGDYQKFNQATGLSVYSVQQAMENNTGAYITKISTEGGPIIFKVRHFNYVFGNTRDSFSYQVK